MVLRLGEETWGGIDEKRDAIGRLYRGEHDLGLAVLASLEDLVWPTNVISECWATEETGDDGSVCRVSASSYALTGLRALIWSYPLLGAHHVRYP